MKPYYEADGITIYHWDVLDWLSRKPFPGDVLVTDPPYGMKHRSSRNGAFGDCEVAGDNDTSARDEVVQRWGAKPALIFGRWSVKRPVGTRMVLVWEKGEHVGMGDLSLPWKPNTEEIYVLGSGFTGRRTGSVLKYHAIAGTVGQAAKGTRHHPDEKPLSLMQALIAKCPPGVIVDPFMGSGTTLRAAKDLGREAIGFELNKSYCATAVRRLGQGVLL